MLLILALLVVVVLGWLILSAAPRSLQVRNVGRRARRIGLGVFFVSVAVNAAIGMYAVLSPHFGDTAGTILGTSLCVTGAIMMALCCEPAWERRLLTPVPVAGALFGAVAFAGLIAALWTDVESATLGRMLASTFAAAIGCTLASVVVLERERKGISLRHKRAIIATLGAIAFDAVVAVAVIWIPSAGPATVATNLIVTAVVATVACVLVGLLTLLRPARPTQRVIDLTLGLIVLAATVAVALFWADASDDTIGKFAGTCAVAAAACALAAFLAHARLAPAHRWVLTTTFALLGAGGVMVVANIWLEGTWGLMRAMGVILIALAAFAVTVPVLHWLDRRAVAAAAATGDTIGYCPHCGKKLRSHTGMETRCERCERSFTVIESDQSRIGAPVAPGGSAGRPLTARPRRSRERNTVSRDTRTR